MSNNTPGSHSGSGTRIGKRTSTKFSSARRRKDRHGRSQAEVFLSPGLPGWKTRRESFDHQVALIVNHMSTRYPEIQTIEFAIEEVPPSAPAAWEDHEICLARVFPRDRVRGINDRIVVYRQAVTHRCDPADQVEFLRLLLAERICQLLAIDPDDLL